MTAEQFVYWLDGFLEGTLFGTDDEDHIRDLLLKQLKKVTLFKHQHSVHGGCEL